MSIPLSESGLWLSTALAAIEGESASHFRSTILFSLEDCAELFEGILFMVANHARKALAREIVTRSGGNRSYTDALASAVRIEGIRGDSGVSKLSPSDQRIVTQASELVLQGRDLIIFGTPYSAKSTTAYAVLQETKLRTLFIADYYLDEIIVRNELRGLPCSVKSPPPSGEMALDPAVELLVIDEPNSMMLIDYSNLLKAKHRVLTIHGYNYDPLRIKKRLCHFLSGAELRDPFFIQVEYDLHSGRRELRLHR